MTELSHEARALIDQGRADDPPSAEDRARVRRRIAAELGGGVFATAAVAGMVASASPATSGGRVLHGAGAWLKGALAVTAIAGGAVIAYVGARPEAQPEDERSAVQRTHADSPAGEREQVQRARLAAPSTTSEEPSATPAVEAAVESVERSTPAPAESARRSRRSRRAQPSAQAAASTPAPPQAAAASAQATADARDAADGSVTAELALLAEAQRALRAGDARTALALSQRHREQFARGTLVEERAGIETLARCKLGEEPEASARAFLARAPSSPIAARVRKECGLE